MENPTHNPTHASVTLRGKTVRFRASNLGDVQRARNDFVAVMGCKDLLAPAVLPSVLRILALSIKDHFPGVKLQTLADELMDTLHPFDLLAIVPVVFDPKNFTPYLQKSYPHKETFHGIH